MFRSVIALSAIGAGTIGTALSLRANDYDVNSLGIVRFGRAAITVFDVGLTYKMQLYYKDWDTSSLEYKDQISKINKIAAEKLLKVICMNRGVYIKIGQHIGALENLLPPEFVGTMKVLHSNAPKNPVEVMYKVIKQDLKKDPSELFESFDPEPLGTASLAQVHKATLKNGDVVAVKIQHPYVKGNARVDMKTMEILVKIMSFIFPEFKIQWLVDESKKSLEIELNFVIDGQNADKVAVMFKNYKWLKIPKIYWEISSHRVLVMEYLDGGYVTDLNYYKLNGIDPFDVSNKIGRLYSDMIFIYGFVHSDPHPGNILVKKNNSGSTDIILLDHGLYANLNDRFRYEYSKLWLSILKVDQQAMKEHAMNLGINGKLYELFACMVTGRPWKAVLSGIDRTAHFSNEKDVLEYTSALHLPHVAKVLAQIDRQMLLVLRTNDLIRGIEATLQTEDQMTAFLVMSKCCVRSVYDEQRKMIPNKLGRFKTILKENWEILKLNVYYLYLGLINFGLVSSIKQLL